jgi:hypothetical protein
MTILFGTKKIITAHEIGDIVYVKTDLEGSPLMILGFIYYGTHLEYVCKDFTGVTHDLKEFEVDTLSNNLRGN